MVYIQWSCFKPHFHGLYWAHIEHIKTVVCFSLWESTRASRTQSAPFCQKTVNISSCRKEKKLIIVPWSKLSLNENYENNLMERLLQSLNIFAVIIAIIKKPVFWVTAGVPQFCPISPSPCSQAIWVSLNAREAQKHRIWTILLSVILQNLQLLIRTKKQYNFILK